jgi:hypothetical protein
MKYQFTNIKRKLLKINVPIWFNNMQSEGLVPKYVTINIKEQ